MNIPARKPRGDSPLHKLNREQKARLAVWLGEENRGYEEAQQLLAREFGVTTSRSALSRYYRRCLLERTTDDGVDHETNGRPMDPLAQIERLLGGTPEGPDPEMWLRPMRKPVRRPTREVEKRGRFPA